MRKILLLITFMSITTLGFSQVELGFKFSPTISTNRIDTDSETVDFSNDGSGLRFLAGPTADFALAENYYVSTGLLLVSKRAAFKATSVAGTEKEEYKLQYLQIPITLKLYTNEVALDKRIYFQVGGSLEINVKEDPKEDNFRYVEDFKIFDSSLIVGTGLEYKVGVSTAIYGGFSYTRGLVNSVGDQLDVGGDLIIKNDYLALDIGVKF